MNVVITPDPRIETPAPDQYAGCCSYHRRVLERFQRCWPHHNITSQTRDIRRQCTDRQETP